MASFAQWVFLYKYRRYEIVVSNISHHGGEKCMNVQNLAALSRIIHMSINTVNAMYLYSGCAYTFNNGPFQNN